MIGVLFIKCTYLCDIKVSTKGEVIVLFETMSFLSTIKMIKSPLAHLRECFNPSFSISGVKGRYFI